MDNLFMSYMSSRYEKTQPNFESGPVITISREFGCSGGTLAKKLAAAIKQRHAKEEWRVISNEVLEESAKELNVKPEGIAHIFGAEAKNMIGDLVFSFATKQYTSDAKIKKTIHDVVQSFASQGHCIIVGRAGCVIAQDFSKSLHIRLIAPIDWRVERVKTRMEIPLQAAKELVEDNDVRRTTFMTYFKGNLPDSKLYDVVYNCAKLSAEQIVENIIHLLVSKGIIK